MARGTILSGADVDQSVQRLYIDYLRTLYVLFKSSFVYAPNNQALVASAERVANAANQIRKNVAEQASLELVPEGVYVNGTLLKLDPGAYDQSEYLGTIFGALGVAAVSAIADTTVADWIELVAAFKHCVGPQGELSEFARTRFASIEITPAIQTKGASDLVAMTSRVRALRAYATTVIAIGDVLDTAREGRALRPLRIKRPLQEVISVSKEASSLLLALAFLKRHKATPQHHLANTAVYSICAVATLDLPRSTVSALGLAAALHDVGRALAPRDAAGPNADRHFALQSIRTLLGTPLSSDEMLGRAVVANEIRRWVDRSAEPPGDTPYPFQLAIATRIVAVAHAYSLLTTPRGRPALLPDEALRVIVRDAGRRYDRAAVRLFVNALGAYPIGSVVALSDGQLAVVTDPPHGDTSAKRPRVKIVRDRAGESVDGAIVDLASAGGVEIVRCVDGDEYAINAPAFLLG
jgi:HD-GYP domain-containing protein (c-di-GMP phosphodiesterase class II)